MTEKYQAIQDFAKDVRTKMKMIKISQDGHGDIVTSATQMTFAELAFLLSGALVAHAKDAGLTEGELNKAMNILWENGPTIERKR